MKTIILFLLISLSSFGQLTKIDTKQSEKVNAIYAKDRELIASAEIYKDSVEIIFLSDLPAHLFFSLTPNEFIQLGDILNSYKSKDKDMYKMVLAFGGSISIRFEEKNAYISSIVSVTLGGQEYLFPTMNRVQYKRLFSI